MAKQEIRTDRPEAYLVFRRMGEQVAISRQVVLIITMVLSTAVSIGLFAYRVMRTDTAIYYTLNWNLFLAWIPVVFAIIAYNVYRKGSCIGAFIALGCAVIWLAFFPNAPYLLTDIVHLRPREEIAYWFDQVLYLAYAWTGCYLGLVSLMFMQTVARRSMGRIAGWIFAVVVLVASGFGIYIGRFLRFNSWDLLLNPGSIFREVFSWIEHPRSNADAYAFSIIFSAFFAAIYFILVAVLNLKREEMV